MVCRAHIPRTHTAQSVATEMTISQLWIFQPAYHEHAT